MASANIVILMGNLTRNPETTFTPSNTAICKFGMAVNRKYKGADGQQKEDVCFVDITAFARTAEIVQQYVHKGDLLFVEGRLNFSSWTAQDGGKRSKLDVVVENIQLMPNGQQNGNTAPQQNQAPQQNNYQQDNLDGF